MKKYILKNTEVDKLQRASIRLSVDELDDLATDESVTIEHTGKLNNPDEEQKITVEWDGKTPDLMVTFDNCGSVKAYSIFAGSLEKKGKIELPNVEIEDDMQIEFVLPPQTTLTICLEPVEREETLGEQRCHLKFNPSSAGTIDQFKKKCADLIDFANELSQGTDNGESKRCFSIAMTEIETAQMYGVKGIAKDLYG